MYQLKHREGYLIHFISKRLVKVIIPYLFMNLFYLLVELLIGSNVSFESIMISFSKGYPLVINSWYIIEIIVFYFAFYVTFKLFRANSKWAVMLLFLFITGFNLICHGLNWGNWWYISSYTFILGIMWCNHEGDILTYVKKHYFINILALIVIFIGVYSLSIIGAKIGMYKTAISFLSETITALVFSVIVILAGIKVQFRNKIWVILGNVSYELYMVHGLVIKYFAIYTKGNELLLAVIVVSLSVVLASLFHYINSCFFKLHNSISSTL